METSTLQKNKQRRTPSPVSRRKPPAGVLPRRRRSPEDILNRIVEAASGEFKRHGFARATTATIARKAGVTEAQLFRCFASKANLFRETIFKPLDRHLSNYIDKYLHEDSHANLSEKADSRLLVRLSFVAVLGSILFKDWIFPPGLASEKEVQEATYHCRDGRSWCRSGSACSSPAPAKVM